MSEIKPHGTAGQAHEAEGSNVRLVFIWVLSLFGLTFASMVISLVFHVGFLKWSPFMRETRPMSPMAQMHRVPPEPRLQSNPTLDMAHFREAEEKALASYGWIDAQAGAVRLPISRAMELVLKEGLPSRKGGSAE